MKGRALGGREIERECGELEIVTKKRKRSFFLPSLFSCHLQNRAKSDHNFLDRLVPISAKLWINAIKNYPMCHYPITELHCIEWSLLRTPSLAKASDNRKYTFKRVGPCLPHTVWDSNGYFNNLTQTKNWEVIIQVYEFWSCTLAYGKMILCYVGLCWKGYIRFL